MSVSSTCENSKTNQIQIGINTIAYQQRILFYGYIRIKIINLLNKKIYKVIPKDVINLCNTFYELNIVGDHEEWILEILNKQYRANKEYFIAYKIAQLLVSCFPTNASYYALLGHTLSNWNLDHQATKSHERAVELEPNKF